MQSNFSLTPFILAKSVCFSLMFPVLVQFCLSIPLKYHFTTQLEHVYQICPVFSPLRSITPNRLHLYHHHLEQVLPSIMDNSSRNRIPHPPLRETAINNYLGHGPQRLSHYHCLYLHHPFPWHPQAYAC